MSTLATAIMVRSIRPALGGHQTDIVEISEMIFRGDFHACLEKLEHAGTFASVAHSSLFVNSGLQVESIGSKGLPLSTRDAQAIPAISRQSTFGRKDKTVVDEAGRKTWELDTTYSSTNKAPSSNHIATQKRCLECLGLSSSACHLCTLVAR